MLSMSPILLSVTHLKLVTQKSDGRLHNMDDRTVGTLIAPLASHLPNLQDIFIDGDYNEELVQAFGLACCKLTHFTDVENDLSPDHSDCIFHAFPLLTTFTVVLGLVDWHSVVTAVDATVNPATIDLCGEIEHCLLTDWSDGSFGGVEMINFNTQVLVFRPRTGFWLGETKD